MWRPLFALALLAGGVPAAAEIVPYAAPQALASDPGVASVVQVDLDHDGDLDLVFANPNAQRVAWLRNDRSGYSVRQTLFSREGVRRLTAADFDRDGRLDLVSATHAGTLAWHRGNGTNGNGVPQFETRSAFATDFDASRTLATGDFNRDGRLDLVAARDGTPALRLYPFVGGSGSGFGSPSALPAPAGVAFVEGLVVGDLDRNGLVDVVVGSLDATRDLAQLYWVPRSTPSAFGTPQLLDQVSDGVSSLEVRLAALSLGHFDADDELDLVYVRDRLPFDASLRLRRNVGGAAPLPVQGLGFTGFVDFTLPHDLDQDGDQDIVYGEGSRIGVQENGAVADNRRAKGSPPPAPGTAFFPFFVTTDAPAKGLALFAQDDDLDGDPDLQLAGMAGELVRLENRRIHGDAFGVLAGEGQNTNLVAPFEVRAGADGSVLFAEFLPGTLRRLTAFDPVATDLGAARALAFGDLDLDGDEDFLLGTGTAGNANPLNQNRLAVGTRQPGLPATWTTQVTTCNQGQDIRAVAIGDLDGVGAPEVVYASEDNDRVAIVIGPCATEVVVSSAANGAPNGPGSLEIADLDGDGRNDLVLAARLDDAPPQLGDLVGWYRNLGGGAFGALQRIGRVNGAVDVVIVDLDRDGRPDVASASQGNPATDPLAARVLLFRNLGGGAFEERVLASGVPDPGRPTFADIDRDGDFDLVVPSTGNAPLAVPRTVCGASLFEQRADGSFAPARCLDRLFAPVPLSRLAAADFNRDGGIDVAATSVSHDRVMTYFNHRPQQLSATRHDEAEALVLRGRESCPTAIDYTHHGRSGDDAIELRSAALSLAPTTAADVADLTSEVRLRRDDGDDRPDPARDALLAQAQPQAETDTRLRVVLVPAGDPQARSFGAAARARMWLCFVSGPQRASRRIPATWSWTLGAAGNGVQLVAVPAGTNLFFTGSTVFRDGAE